jgi:hypothetical protein
MLSTFVGHPSSDEDKRLHLLAVSPVLDCLAASFRCRRRFRAQVIFAASTACAGVS